MSQNPNDPKSKIEDLPERTNELTPEELENVAGGVSVGGVLAGCGGGTGTKKTKVDVKTLVKPPDGYQWDTDWQDDSMKLSIA